MEENSGLSRDETLDALFQGRLAIIQKKRGYRFSLDAVLLARFVRVRRKEKMADLGTGNGVIPLIVSCLYPSVRVVGVEIQREMAARALRSVGLNRMEDRVEIVQGDICSIERVLPPRNFDVVVCNPPYRGPGSGRISPDAERRIARHEIQGTLGDFLRAASYLLRRGGRIDVVYPASRMPDLLQAMRRERMEPKRLRLVHSFEGAVATLVLVEGVKDAGSEIEIMPPLVIYTRGRKYTQEMKAMLSISFPSGKKRSRVFSGPGGVPDP